MALDKITVKSNVSHSNLVTAGGKHWECHGHSRVYFDDLSQFNGGKRVIGNLYFESGIFVAKGIAPRTAKKVIQSIELAAQK